MLINLYSLIKLEIMLVLMCIIVALEKKMYVIVHILYYLGCKSCLHIQKGENYHYLIIIYYKHREYYQK